MTYGPRCDWCGEPKIEARAGSRYCGLCNSAWAEGRVGELYNRFAASRMGEYARTDFSQRLQGCEECNQGWLDVEGGVIPCPACQPGAASVLGTRDG